MSPGASFTLKSPAGSTPVSVPESSDDLWQRFDSVLQHDREKTDLMQEVLYRHAYLSQQYKQVTDQLRSAGSWPKEKKQYDDTINTLRIALERDPFVVVLIDGDAMLFQDELIRAGEQGGRFAAYRLHKAIMEHIQLEKDYIPTHSRVICRIYAHLRGLADVLVRTGVIDDAETVEQFAHGFTQHRALFDFIDVGPGKDRAGEKMNETLKLYLHDFHCRQVYFGCCHDNGYVQVLEEYATDELALQRVTLLEGAPFGEEFMALNFATKKFRNIFRDSKLVNPVLSGVAKNYNILSGLPSRFPAPPPKSLPDSPVQVYIKSNIPRTPSNSTLASTENNPNSTKAGPLGTWASKAAAPAPPVTELPTYKPANREDIIARNRAGQRVDPPCRDYDKAEVDRIKRLKMCNVHFLRSECPFGSQCTHIHTYKPTRDELNTLRFVARMAPCVHGSGCADVKCIYGHRCPASSAKNPGQGTKMCSFGDQCKFPPELHDIDCNVVKTLVIR